MARTEEELMDLAGSEVVSRRPSGGASRLGIASWAAQQLKGGASTLAVANALSQAGWPTARVKRFVNHFATRTGTPMVRSSGASAYDQVKDVADAADAFQKGRELSNVLLSLTSESAGGDGPGVKAMQKELAGIGMPVRPTGVVDAATVSAINEVFHGWDDAPPALASGTLTAKQIAKNLPTVQKYLKKAIGGAQEFGDATKDG